MLQTSDNIIYAATNGQSGRYGFSGQEVGKSALFGAILGGGAKVLSEYGNYTVQYPVEFQLSSVAPSGFGSIKGFRNPLVAPEFEVGAGSDVTWASIARAEGAPRRPATTGDTQFRTQDDALAEALERYGIDPSTIEIKKMFGKNDSLVGPKGKPWEIVSGLTPEGKVIDFQHHASGHFFNDKSGYNYELPHYQGPKGEHLTY